jgi:hypothetical protein
MTIHFEPTVDEFVESLMEATRQRRRQMAWTFGSLALVFLALGCIPGPGRPLSLITALGCLGLTMRLRRSYAGTFRRHWDLHPYHAEAADVTLTPAEFTRKTYSGSEQARWHVFSHWGETTRLFLIFRGPSECYFIPKRAIDGEDAIAACRHLLDSTIGRTKYAPRERAFPVTLLQETTTAAAAAASPGPIADGAEAPPQPR